MKKHFTKTAIAASLFCATSLNYSSIIAQENPGPGAGTPHRNAVKFEMEKDASKGEGSFTTMTANFVEMGKPTNGYNDITDIVTFGGKLFLATSKDPLGDWGTTVFSTSDGVSYTKVLSDANSQGYLRMGVFDNKLWIPDGDPNGLDPGYVYISSTGAYGSFTTTQIIQAVHTFDIIKYNNQVYTANGMGNYLGGLCKYNGTSTWNSVSQPSSSFRLKYMTQAAGKLYVSNDNPNSDVDYFIYNGDPATVTPTQKNVLTGPSMTFRMYTSSTGKIFWTVAANNQIRCMMSSDGNTWSPVTGLDGKFVSDYCEMNGKMYILAQNGLWESSDFTNFTQIATPPASDPNAFMPVPVSGGYNSDGLASMEPFNGSIWCGSSTNGKVYKVDILGTSASEIQGASTHYIVTGHSIIFQLEHNTPVELRVYNLCGSLVKDLSGGMVSAGIYEVELGELKAGFYLLEAIIGNEVKGIKFIR